MAQTPVTTATITSQSRGVRNIVNEIGDLEPNIAVLTTALLKLKKKTPTDNVKFEWMDQDLRARWAQISNNTYNSSATSIVLATGHGARFAAGDTFIVPKVISSSVQPEECLITAVDASTDTLTIVRGYSGTTAASISANTYIRRTGSAHAEGSNMPAYVESAINTRFSYTQFMRASMSLTRQFMASRQYGDAGNERKRRQTQMMKEFKESLNSTLIWGTRANTTLSSAPLTKTDGVNAVISRSGSESVVFDAGGMLTWKLFTSFAKSSFRWGSDEKLLLASSTMVRAVNQWAFDRLQVKQGTNEIGMRVSEITTEFGKWMMVYDRMLEDPAAGASGFEGTTFSLDLNEITLRYLKYGKYNCDIQLYEDVVADDKGGAQVTDEIMADIGLQVGKSRNHCKLFNLADYQ